MIRRRTMIGLLGLLLLSSPTTQAGAEDAAKPRIPRISDLGFLEGSWIAEGGGTTTREHWLPGSDDAMAAVTHMTRSGKTALYELSAIEAREDGIHLSIRHFGAKLKPWASEAEGPGTWKLASVKRGDGKKVTATFSRQGSFPQHIVYARTSETTLDARLEGAGDDGQPHSMVFAFKRP